MCIILSIINIHLRINYKYSWPQINKSLTHPSYNIVLKFKNDNRKETDTKHVTIHFFRRTHIKYRFVDTRARLARVRRLVKEFLAPPICQIGWHLRTRQSSSADRQLTRSIQYQTIIKKGASAAHHKHLTLMSFSIQCSIIVTVTNNTRFQLVESNYGSYLTIKTRKLLYVCMKAHLRTLRQTNW